MSCFHGGFFEKKYSWYRGRVQDFLQEGAPILQEGVPTYKFARFSKKTAWNFGPWGGGGERVGGTPLGSATAQ